MNYIWAFLIIFSFIFGAINGKLSDVVNAILSGAETSIKIALGIAGVMVFWLGIMKITEDSGLVKKISEILRPAAKILFPEAADNDEIAGNVALNFSANALGLANAATPAGIKAMEEMQKINRNKSSASNPMCMLLAMNTAGFQLIPATVIAILAAAGSQNPTEIIIPTLLVTSGTFISAIVIAKIFEKFYPAQKTEDKPQ